MGRAHLRAHPTVVGAFIPNALLPDINNAAISANADVSANTSARHDAVTLGAGNGTVVSLAGQVLTASDAAISALVSSDAAVAANTAARHAAVTLGTTNGSALTLTGQEIAVTDAAIDALVSANADVQAAVTVDAAAVTVANLQSAAHAVNTTNKKLGKIVQVSDLNGGAFAMASGAAATSAWLEIGSVTAATPA